MMSERDHRSPGDDDSRGADLTAPGVDLAAIDLTGPAVDLSVPAVSTAVAIPAADVTATEGTAAEGTAAEGPRLNAATSLSPSRASDFMSCPLLYRFRVIDRLPQRPSIAAVRGSVVHKVLEDLFDLPARERTHDRASLMLAPVWENLLAEEPELAAMFSGGGSDTAGPTVDPADPSGSADPGHVDQPAADLAAWLDQCRDLLQRYFTLEDPQRLEPAEREVHVVTTLPSGLTIHGYVDRLDRAPTGELRIVDYKTGASPGERFEAKALFQMKFYALVVWRTRGVIPALLQLVYLGNAEMLRYRPDEADLLATERKVEALWKAIRLATETGDWRPNKSRLCDWCDHQALCPAWGGTPPPLPEPRPEPVAESAAQAPPMPVLSVQ